MIKANLNSKFKIKEDEAGSYHVFCKRIQLLDPKDPTKQDVSQWVSIFLSRREYDDFEKSKKACGVNEAELVHDGGKWKAENAERLAKEAAITEEERKAAIKAELIAEIKAELKAEAEAAEKVPKGRPKTN